VSRCRPGEKERREVTGGESRRPLRRFLSTCIVVEHAAFVHVDAAFCCDALQDAEMWGLF